MRSARAVAACVLLAFAAGACDQLDRRYLREGVGTTLYTEELPDRTRLQDLYVGYICHQAGLSTIASPEVIQLCDDVAISRGDWRLFVQAGFNDIDQRCDAYLSWLDYRKRAAGAWHQQILNTQTALNLILAPTDPGPKAIAIVGAAFGFASSTFTNFTSRLLLEVDQSTVQTVVLTRQNQFRKEVPRVIDNKAAAIYALRSYLRLCMPMTIETQINTTVKLFERGGPIALEDADANPMISGNNVRTAVLTDANAPLPAQPKRRVNLPTRLTPYEQSLTAPYIREIQRALCVSVTGDLGPRGSPTRRAIEAYLVARGQPASQTIDQRIDGFLDEAIEKVRGSCSAQNFNSATDVGRSFR
jgi:hypothetical protein